MRRLQNRLATSRLSLPAVALYALALWAVLLMAAPRLLPGLVLFSVSTALMVELNNRNALMRQYSRMVSCAYVVMMMMCPWLLTDIAALAVQLCLLASLSLLFTTYQRRLDMGRKYWAYLFVGVASLLWPPVIVVTPLLWIGEGAFLMSFSPKALAASVLGLVTPWWIAVPVVWYAGLSDKILEWLQGFVPDFSATSVATEMPTAQVGMIAVLSFLALLLFIGIVHFFRQSYADKIQVRMLYQFFTMLAVVLAVVIAAAMALPHFSIIPYGLATEIANFSLSLEIVCLAPFVAHFVTFTSSRLTNITTVCLLIIALLLTAAGFLLLIAGGIPDNPILPWTL